MRLGAVLFALALSASAHLPAIAQTGDLIDGSTVDDIVNIARGYGSATLESQEDGNPKITGRIDGISYSVWFLNCDDNHVCEDLNFYAGFLDIKPSLEQINTWNRDKRFGKAYLDNDLDAVVEMDVNIEHGISRTNLDSTIGVWRLVLDQYTDFIGFK